MFQFLFQKWVMREFDDYDDSLHNSENFMTHPLPSYTYANFVQEYPKTCAVTAALFTIAVSVYFWKLLQMKRQEQEFNDILCNGRFSHSILRRIQHRNVDKNADATEKEQIVSVSDEKQECADENSSDEEDDSLLEKNRQAPRQFESQKNPIHNKQDAMAAAFDRASDEEKSEIIASLGVLHGKLATAELRAKAKKMENAMSEEERKEERLIRQKQLESICEMIMQKPEKFGVHDKSEIMEQMKLYSI